MKKNPFVMVVLDGWGIGRKDDTNPIYTKNPKTIDFIKHNYLSGAIQASGIAVGLPWEEEGNSEVGHLTLGAGRVLYQHYPRITLTIRSGKFFENAVLLEAFRKAKEENKNLHIVGVLSEGNVHSALQHVEALIEMGRREKLTNINLHIFADGKDGPPKDTARLLTKLTSNNADQFINIGSVGGRYYGMDRDGNMDRTARAYSAIIGSVISNFEFRISNGSAENAIEYIESQYAKGITDEFIEPITIDARYAVKDGDYMILFNFREDSMRQLVEQFISTNNESSTNIQIKDLGIVTFTQYSDKYNLPVAFPSERVTNPLGKILSDRGLSQLRIAETNKYAHITYFFNGFQEKPFPNEYRVLIPSQSVSRHDERPEMMAEEITARVIEAISENVYDFILINYANADVVAHTGNYEATLKAIATLDVSIQRLMDAVLRADGVLLITSDHGNAEKLLDTDTGSPETKHDKSPVPIYIVGNAYKVTKDDFAVEQTESQSSGLLSDVAPTILDIMGIPQPQEMTGISLLKILQ